MSSEATIFSPGSARCAPQARARAGHAGTGCADNPLVVRSSESVCDVVQIRSASGGRRGVPDAQGEADPTQRNDDRRAEAPVALAPSATATATAKGSHSSIAFFVIR